jgi:hypothetical protein
MTDNKASLRIRHKPGTPLTSRHKQDFLQVALDERLSDAQKQAIYLGEMTVDEARQQQYRWHTPKPIEYDKVEPSVLENLDPCFIDPRIQELASLDPKELAKRVAY